LWRWLSPSRRWRIPGIRPPAAAIWNIGQFAAIQSMASSSAVELSAIDTRDKARRFS